MREIRQAYELNELRACGLIGITRWSNRYQSRRDPQTELRVRLRDLASTRLRYGYRRLTVLLRREGWHVNTKRVYCLFRLKIPHCTGRKFPHPPELMVYRFSRLVENGTGW